MSAHVAASTAAFRAELRERIAAKRAANLAEAGLSAPVPRNEVTPAHIRAWAELFGTPLEHRFHLVGALMIEPGASAGEVLHEAWARGLVSKPSVSHAELAAARELEIEAFHARNARGHAAAGEQLAFLREHGLIQEGLLAHA